jgi:hypothetical protein
VPLVRRQRKHCDLAGSRVLPVNHTLLWREDFCQYFPDATEQLAKTLLLQPLEGTDVPINTITHTLKLFSKTITGGHVGANTRMVYSTKSGVTSKIVVRAEDEVLAALVVGSVA